MIRKYITAHGGTFRSAFHYTLRRIYQSNFAQRVFETFAARVFIILVSFANSIFVTRALGPEGKGFYSVALAVMAIGIQFGNFGLHSSNTYAVARDRGALPSLVGNSLGVSFGFGGAAIFIAWLFFHFVPGTLPVDEPLLLMALVSIPFGLATLLLQNLLIGIQDSRSYNVIEVLTRILSFSLALAVIFLNQGTVYSLFAVTLVSGVFGFGLNLRKVLAHTRQALGLSQRLFLENIRYGIKAYLASFLAYLVLRIDLLMVQYMVGAKEAGFYSTASQMADMVYLFSSVAGTIFFPKVSEKKDRREKWDMTLKIGALVGVVLAFMAVGAAFLARPLVLLAFGKAFAPSVPPFELLVPGVFFWGISTFPLLYLASVGFPYRVVYGWVFLVALNIGLNFYFIPHFGICGASVVSTVTYFLGFIIFGFYAWKVSRE